MSEWRAEPLGTLAGVRRGISYSEGTLQANSEDGRPYINMKSFLKDGGYNKDGLKFFSGHFTKADVATGRDLLLANTDVTPNGDIIGVPAYLPSYLQDEGVLFSHHVTRLNLNDKIQPKFLYYLLCIDTYRRSMLKYARGTTVLMLDMDGIKRISVKYPVSDSRQRKIACILTSIDTAIEKTESLISKYQKIKAGLMHDLFTRGVTADGKLRPPREQAPELYHETSAGWVPVEWEFGSISSIMESLIDGPFGSNLKTEHYVIDPGVRVVRLQNIQATSYNDNDRAYVSDKHAAFLLRNKVLSGDILIAGLGEDRYPVGRACLYPDNLPPAINKADCFRLRCKVDEAENPFVMLYLNTEPARVQIRKYEQGVTRPRINSGNFKKLIIPKPSIEEQKIITGQIMKVAEIIEVEKKRNHKLIMEKLGLMQDLLTGKVPVKIDEPDKEFA